MVGVAIRSMPSGPVHGHEMRKFILRNALPVLTGWEAVSGRQEKAGLHREEAGQ